MSTMIETMKNRLKTAMKAQDEIEKSILRVTLSECEALANSASQANKPLTDEQVHKVIRKIIVSNLDTLPHTSGTAKAALERENLILSEFLPKMLTKAEIALALVSQANTLKTAKEGQAIGLAMKYLKELSLAVDGNDVKQVVLELRNQG